LYVIAGNHDCAKTNTNKINSVSLLGTPNMHVIDMKPETVLIDGVLIDMYPWINSENLSESIDFQKESNSKYAVGHFEFKGFPMHPGTLCESGISHSQFSRYDKVFSGHFHTISQQGNVMYTGTPCELSWSDWNDPKGFWVLDTETSALEHIRNPYTLFEKITYSEGMRYDYSRATDKYIKVIVADKTDQKKFDSFIDNLNHNKPHSIKIIESNITASVGESVYSVEVASTHTMISDVVDNLDTGLDKVVLKTHIMSLYVEAMQLSKTV
jgi:DNA repair exonuclease SbcCD nuclease subunit